MNKNLQKQKPAALLRASKKGLPGYTTFEKHLEKRSGHNPKGKGGKGIAGRKAIICMSFAISCWAWLFQIINLLRARLASSSSCSFLPT